MELRWRGAVLPTVLRTRTRFLLTFYGSKSKNGQKPVSTLSYLHQSLSFARCSSTSGGVGCGDLFPRVELIVINLGQIPSRAGSGKVLHQARLGVLSAGNDWCQRRDFERATKAKETEQRKKTAFRKRAATWKIRSQSDAGYRQKTATYSRFSSNA